MFLDEKKKQFSGTTAKDKIIVKWFKTINIKSGYRGPDR